MQAFNDGAPNLMMKQMFQKSNKQRTSKIYVERALLPLKFSRFLPCRWIGTRGSSRHKAATSKSRHKAATISCKRKVQSKMSSSDDDDDRKPSSKPEKVSEEDSGVEEDGEEDPEEGGNVSERTRLITNCLIQI